MNHIGVYDNVISKEGCRKIIKYFDDSPRKESAHVAGHEGNEINPKFKNGTNVTVWLSNCDKTMYNSLNEYILPALGKGLGEYKKKFPFINHGLDAWSIDDAFNIQKFDEQASLPIIYGNLFFLI